MVSATKVTTRRRNTRANQRSRWNKSAGKTPAFAIHPEGYDQQAPDAKKAKTAAG